MNPRQDYRREAGVSWLTLLASTGTLVCCALPIMLVTLGLGAAVVSLTSALPFLIVLSQHKVWVFAFSALMLAITAWTLYRAGRVCPADTATGELCRRAQRWNRRIFWSAVVIWVVGFSAAYLALPLRQWLDF